MSATFGTNPYQLPERQLTGLERLRLYGAAALVGLIIGLALVVRTTPSAALGLAVGDISPRDIVSPRAITYPSEVLTERARSQAESEVGVIYDAPDASVGRREVSLAHQTLDRISSLRADATLTPGARAEALTRLAEVPLSEEAAERILVLDDEQWAEVEPEVVRVLESAMRGVIRDVDLDEARRRVPTLVSFDMSDEQSRTVTALVTALVVPNTLANEQRTTEARRLARENVQPVVASYQAGQAVVRVGERVTELQMEALRHIGLLEPVSSRQRDLGAIGVAMLLSLVVVGYIITSEPALSRDWRRLTLLAVAGVAAAGAARVMIPGSGILAYMFPAAALPMLVGVLVSPGAGLFSCLLPLGFYVLLLGESGVPDQGLYGLVGGLVGVLALGQVRSMRTFVTASLVVAVANVAVLLLAWLPGGDLGVAGLAGLLAAGVVSAIFSGTIALLGYLLFSSLTGTVTSLQLLELARPTQPLLRDLALQAPGTYHHSLMVANLAEQATERVGGNALLARVGAYYHDAGKVLRPYFFAENQAAMGNVHERLDPLSSAAIIIGHVEEGLSLGRKHRLPPAVLRFMAEHHGRARQDYFYNEGVRRMGEENVDEEQFRYHGPRPQTKETAIVMLADACEAVTRAARPATRDEVARLVERVVDDRVLEGELDECPLTLHDIAAIKVSFVNALQGVFHPRVTYPEGSLVASRPEARRPAPAPSDTENALAPEEASE